MKNEYIMKRWPLLAVAVTLLLCLFGGGAMAAPGLHTVYLTPAASKNYPLWPKGTKLQASVFYFGPTRDAAQFESLSWPVATGADHYQLSITQGSTVVSSVDPVVPHAGSTSTTVLAYYSLPPGSYTFTVTAYSSPDEATARSQSIQTELKVPVRRP
jgi:hypothetical protein